MFNSLKKRLRKKERSFRIDEMLATYKDEQKTFFFQTPEHGNLGDHAIAIAGSKIIDYFNKDSINFEFYYSDFKNYRNIIKRYVSSEDKVFLIGGGNFGNLYPKEERQRQELVEEFKNNNITILPQSINFSDDDEGHRLLRKSQKIYERCKKLTIITRDQYSHKFAVENFNNNVLLSPDTALYLDGEFDEMYSKERRGVVFTVRGDKEKCIDNNLFENTLYSLSQSGMPVTMTDTVVNRKVRRSSRLYEVRKILSEISNAKVNVTDRYHGVIFSILTNTPVLAYKSLDHKIVEGMKWFKGIDWVHYLENDEDPLPLIKRYAEGEKTVNRNVCFKHMLDSIFEI